MPDATEEERETARANLSAFLISLVRVAARLAREDRDSLEVLPEGKIPPSPETA